MTVLKRAGTVGVEAVLTAAQLRWTGHASCMSDDRLPKHVKCSEVFHERQQRGGQKMHNSDMLKRYAMCTKLYIDTCEQQALTR